MPGLAYAVLIEAQGERSAEEEGGQSGVERGSSLGCEGAGE